MALVDQIIETTEVRRHNGQCGYGPWIGLVEAPPHVQEVVSDEIVEALSRDLRHEAKDANTVEHGNVEVGGVKWLYRR